MALEDISSGKENQISSSSKNHQTKIKKKQISSINALSVVPPNVSSSSSSISNLTFNHNINIPDNYKDLGNKLWKTIQQDSSSATHWWHWIHFLHARSTCEASQMLSICDKALSYIKLTDKSESKAKILLVQCKFLYSLQKYSQALEIYKNMYDNKIGHTLYYYWINYATILQKSDNSKKAVKILHCALSEIKFSQDEQKKIQSTLESITRDIVNSKSPVIRQQYKKKDNNTNKTNDLTSPSSNKNDDIPQTPTISNNSTNQFKTPTTNTKYNPLNETPVYHSINRSARKPRTLIPFPSKFESGPARVRKSSGSESTSGHQDDIISPNSKQEDKKEDDIKEDINTNKTKKTINSPPIISINLVNDSSTDGQIDNNNNNNNNNISNSTNKQQQQITPKKQLITKKVTKKTTPSSSKKESHSSSNIKLQELSVHNKTYYCLGIIGKGGSSRVLKVIGGRKFDQIYAIKQVDLSDQDEQTCEGFRNEINLLRSLKGEPNVVHLIDYEITNKRLSIVLELGEIDLRHLLHRLKKQPQSSNKINYIKLYWQQMLEALQVIHKKRIVHGDLKPANFVSFKGILKLIDFGIAGAIQSNTTNIKRESMIGTLNYIAPEALDLTPNPTIKMGVASDVWSMGIILYEMAYHTTPFASITNMFQKVQSIISDKYIITFDDNINQPELINVLQGCLKRDPKQRLTVEELLSHPFLS